MPDNNDNDIRIGVFVCHCGSNIAGYLDVEALADYAQTLPQVTFVQRNLYSCSESGINQIKKGIEEQNLNRVVVPQGNKNNPTNEPLRFVPGENTPYAQSRPELSGCPLG